nr:3'-5' exonuclease [Natrinema gelatinilyticum]
MVRGFDFSEVAVYKASELERLHERVTTLEDELSRKDDRIGRLEAELEAKALASRLSQLLAAPLQIYPEHSDDESEDDVENEPETEQTVSSQHPADGGVEHPAPRDIEPNDIAILIRSRTHLKKYERALEDADVPYSVASGVGFYDSTEITALVNLLRALADPTDERALYAALRSPIFGVTDDTLAQLKLDGEPLWEALVNSEYDELTDCYEYLREWQRRAGASSEGATGFDGSWAAFLTEILAA